MPHFLGLGGGGGSGNVGDVSPIARPGSYTAWVWLLLWRLVTLLGTVTVCPWVSVMSDDRPLASAISYHSEPSPHMALAT